MSSHKFELAIVQYVSRLLLAGEQVGVALSQIPLSWHRMTFAPTVSYPSMHTKYTLEPEVKLRPTRLPFKGTPGSMHITPVRSKCKSSQAMYCVPVIYLPHSQTIPPSRWYHHPDDTTIQMIPPSRRYHRPDDTTVQTIPLSRRYHRPVFLSLNSTFSQ